MIKNAIFDFDGTLANSMELWKNIGSEYLKSIGIEPKSNVDLVLKELRIEKAAEYFIEEYKLKLTKEEVLTGITNYVYDRYRYDVTLKDGVEDFLKTLHSRKINMGIATANDLRLINVVLEKFGFEKYFTEIYNCDMVGEDKFSPAIYEKVMENFGGTKEDTLIFEDAFYAINTLYNAGFKVIGVYDKSEEKQDELKALVNLFINDYYDIDKILSI